MGTKEKLIERFKSLPANFTFEEMERLLSIFGYENRIKVKLPVRELSLRMETNAL